MFMSIYNCLEGASTAKFKLFDMHLKFQQLKSIFTILKLHLTSNLESHVVHFN